MSNSSTYRCPGTVANVCEMPPGLNQFNSTEWLPPACCQNVPTCTTPAPSTTQSVRVVSSLNTPSKELLNGVLSKPPLDTRFASAKWTASREQEVANDKLRI